MNLLDGMNETLELLREYVAEVVRAEVTARPALTIVYYPTGTMFRRTADEKLEVRIQIAFTEEPCKTE